MNREFKESIESDFESKLSVSTPSENSFQLMINLEGNRDSPGYEDCWFGKSHDVTIATTSEEANNDSRRNKKDKRWSSKCSK